MDLYARFSPCNALYTARIGTSEDDYCSRSWSNSVHVSVDAPVRKSPQSSGFILFISAKAKTKKVVKEALEREKAIQKEQRELLAQVLSLSLSDLWKRNSREV